MKQKVVTYHKFNATDIARLVGYEIDAGRTVQCMMEIHNVVIVVYNEPETPSKISG